MSKFPTYPGASFSEADVENYLEELSEKGWGVFLRGNEYVVVIDDGREISAWFNSREKKWTVDASHQEGTFGFSANPIVSFSKFKEHVAKAAEYLGQPLENGPRNIRLRADTPVSNKTSIARLAHGNAVKCVFDSYFDDKSIATLLTLVNLGMTMDSNVRILTNSNKRAKLSSQLIENFKAEKGICLDVRFCSADQHRRYLLLSSGESLIVGCSLNALDKNEAAHIEDSPVDRDFFEEQWKRSSSL
jgi:hypothetical protein